MTPFSCPLSTQAAPKTNNSQWYGPDRNKWLGEYLRLIARPLLLKRSAPVEK